MFLFSPEKLFIPFIYLILLWIFTVAVHINYDSRCSNRVISPRFMILKISISLFEPRISHSDTIGNAHLWCPCEASSQSGGSLGPWSPLLGWLQCASPQSCQPSSGQGQTLPPNTPWWSIAWCLQRKTHIHTGRPNTDFIIPVIMILPNDDFFCLIGLRFCNLLLTR